MSSFKFNPRALERAVLQAADGAVRRKADNLQTVVDNLERTHQGRPVDEVKVALRTAWRSATGDGDITDPELTQWATHISEGRHINVRYDGLGG